MVESSQESCGRCRALDLVIQEKDNEIAKLESKAESFLNVLKDIHVELGTVWGEDPYIKISEMKSKLTLAQKKIKRLVKACEEITIGFSGQFKSREQMIAEQVLSEIKESK